VESAAASEEGVVVYADRPAVEVAWVVLEEGAATVAEVEVAMEEAVVVMAPALVAGMAALPGVVEGGSVAVVMSLETELVQTALLSCSYTRTGC
jgi:hypothetical protein